MLGESIFIGILGALLVPAFAILASMLNLSMNVRDEVEECTFTTRKNERLPRCIKDIEMKSRARNIAHLYYVYSKIVLITALFGFSATIATCMLAIAPYVVLHGNTVDPPEYAFWIQISAVALAATTSSLSISRFIAIKIKVKKIKGIL